MKKEYDYIYPDTKCAISHENLADINDAIVFKIDHRVYSKRALLNWYVSQLKNGKVELMDILNKKVLPPVEIKKSFLGTVFSFVPQQTNLDLIVFSTAAIPLFFIGSMLIYNGLLVKRNLNNNELRNIMNNDTLSNTDFIANVSLIAGVIGIFLATGLGIPNLLRNNTDIGDDVVNSVKNWLENQSEKYNPKKHIPIDNYDFNTDKPKADFPKDMMQKQSETYNKKAM